MYRWRVGGLWNIKTLIWQHDKHRHGVHSGENWHAASGYGTLERKELVAGILFVHIAHVIAALPGGVA